MATTLRTDPERGPGFARICFDVGAGPLPNMPAGFAFTLQRASDALFLAHNGWQESQTELTPESLTRQDSALELCLGPHVVDNLDILNTYRIHLRHTSIAASVIHIESLEYSPLKGKEGLHIAPPTPPVPPVIPITPDAVQEPIAEAPAGETTENTTQNMTVPLSMAAESTPQAEGKKNPFWILLLLLLVAGLGASAGLYWYNQRVASPVTLEAPATQAAPAKPETATNPAKAEAPASSEASPQAAPLSPLAQARQHLQGSGEAAQSLTLARQLQSQQSTQASDPSLQNQQADAVFLLVEDAAQKGQGEAMILLARYFDPVDKAPKGSIHSDPLQAMHWYEQARAAGQNTEAEAGLTALRAWATTAAAAGDKAAQQILQKP